VWKPVFGKDHASHKIQTSRSPRPSKSFYCGVIFSDAQTFIRRPRTSVTQKFAG
jgi:hypothetical protein